ncbi:MAG: hypothetical protein O3B31_03775 [Chloroflexi bacterium]|nr:hypothetical protein [Chloroflexota bacterium]MDA1002458.1 hypothetical protein [Chloroflexota bacterium]MQC27509.1 hypothetical protein [Chloroflexota bacterium]
MLDNGVETDLDVIRANIDEAEVVSLYFPSLGKTLLIDNRASAHVGPMVRLLPMASSSADRLRSIRRLRPELPRPTSVTWIPWTRRVASLLSLGVWERIIVRFDVHEDPHTPSDAALECLETLRRLELNERRCAITGDRYRTLWQRDAAALD